MALTDEVCFYHDANSGKRLYKVRTDGSDLTELLNGYSEYPINEYTDIVGVEDNWVYFFEEYDASAYTGINGRYFKVHMDGSKEMELFSGNGTGGLINIIGDWVYCRNSRGLQRFHVDGSAPPLALYKMEPKPDQRKQDEVVKAIRTIQNKKNDDNDDWL